MPRGKEDWSKGKIYKIISNNPDIKEVYYGSTCQRLLSSRMAQHRSAFKRYINGDRIGGCSSFDMFDKYGIDQFHIELVEDYPCENGEQLYTRENIYIRGNECINKRPAITTPEEKKEQKKQYCQDNKEQILKHKKEYYQDNKEEIIKHKKEYYQDKKEAIDARLKEKNTCECGCVISRASLNAHKKTKKHKSLISVQI